MYNNIKFYILITIHLDGMIIIIAHCIPGLLSAAGWQSWESGCREML